MSNQVASPSPADAEALAARLREAVTVLDEPFHRETIAGVLAVAAELIIALARWVQSQRERADEAEQRCERLVQEQEHERHEKETVADAMSANVMWQREQRAKLEAALAETQARLAATTGALLQFVWLLDGQTEPIPPLAWHVQLSHAKHALAARVGATPQGGRVTYRKKPVVVEAVQWTGANVDEVLALGIGVASFRRHAANTDHETLLIETLEGVMTASRGDWIIRGVEGECYPCRPSIFAATYELVEAPR